MTFRQLIKYNMRNIFLEKLSLKYGRKTSSRPFSGKLKLSISKALCSLYLLYPKLRAIEMH